MKSLGWLVCISAALLFAASPSSRADVIELKDGSVIKGKVLEEKPGVSYRMKLSDGSEIVYPISEIESVRYGKTKASAAEREMAADTSDHNPTMFVAPYGAYSIGISDPEPQDTVGGGMAFHLDFLRLYGEFLTTTESPNTYYYGGGGDLCIVLIREGDINPYIGGGGGFYGWSVDGFDDIEMAYVVEGMAGIRMGYFNLFAKYRRFVWTEADFADGADYIQIGAGLAF